MTAKWTFEKVEEATDAIYEEYMNEEELDEEFVERNVSALLLLAGWSAEEFDEEVLARWDGPGCRKANAVDTN